MGSRVATKKNQLALAPLEADHGFNLCPCCQGVQDPRSYGAFSESFEPEAAPDETAPAFSRASTQLHIRDVSERQRQLGTLSRDADALMREFDVAAQARCQRVPVA